MPYTTEQELVDRYGEDELIALSDRAMPPAGAIDPAIVAKAIADAGDLVDSYIARRYDLPLAEVPSRLVKIASDIARYHLYKDGATEAVSGSYKDAVQFLRDVAAGRAELDVAGEEPTASSDTSPEVGGADATFTMENLEGYR